MKPIILQGSKNTLADLKKLKRQQKIWKTIDTYAEQLTELFEVQNPSLLFTSGYKTALTKFIQSRQPAKNGFDGDWIYYPWNGQLVHVLKKSELDLVRTNRNRNIITAEEQKKLAATTIGILGLSIGNGMAVSMAYNGIGGQMKIADFDKLSVSNLNRIRAGLGETGNQKVEITSQQIYEVNPHAKLVSFPKGVKKQELDSFLTNSPRVDIVLEAIDDFEMKIRVRMAAKKAKIPVVMLTNLGDTMLIDIERYDTDKNTKLFNGLIGKTAEEILSKPITEEDKKKYALAIVGRENVPPRVLESVMEINKTLVGRPQVMSTVTIGSGIAAYVVRKILLGEKVTSGRRRIVFDDFLMGKK